MNEAVSRIVDAIMGALDLFRFWIVLYEYERGVILRLGRCHRDVGPGWHWRIPFRIEELRFVNVRSKTTNSWDLTHTLSTGSTVTVGFTSVVSVADARAVLLGLDDWESTAHALMTVTISERLNAAEDSILTSESERLAIVDAVSVALASVGVKLDHFGFQDFAKTRSYKFFNGAR